MSTELFESYFEKFKKQWFMLLDADLNAAIELRNIAAEYALAIKKLNSKKKDIELGPDDKNAAATLLLYQLNPSVSDIGYYMELYCIVDIVDEETQKHKKKLNHDHKINQAASDLGIIKKGQTNLDREAFLITTLISICGSIQAVEYLKVHHPIATTIKFKALQEILINATERRGLIRGDYVKNFKEVKDRIIQGADSPYTAAIGAFREYRNTKSRNRLIQKLQAYIKKIDLLQMGENINFEAGFYVRQKSRAKSREANYKLAKALLEDLNNENSIQQVFSSKTAIEERRKTLLGEEKFNQLSFFGKKTIRGGLRDILVEAEKVTGHQLK